LRLVIAFPDKTSEKINKIIAFINEHDFMFLRDYFLNKTTIPELKFASTLPNTTDISHDNEGDQTVTIAPQNQESKWIRNLLIHYTYEQRLTTYICHQNPCSSSTSTNLFFQQTYFW
jgi:hypothetical protein